MRFQVDEDGDTEDSTVEGQPTSGTATAAADDEDPPRRRRRGRGRSSCESADESADEILRAVYRRELDDHITPGATSASLPTT